MQGVLLVTLLAVPLVATSSQPISIWGVHPASLFLIAAYGFGLKLITQAKTDPMWKATDTQESNFDQADSSKVDQISMMSLWLQFVPLAVVIGGDGYVVAQTGGAIATQTGLSDTVVGAMLTAISTSLPELVTAIAAVRRGALTLAVGDIIGGNCFDVLFLAFADIAYRGGSIYHAISDREVFIVSLTLLLIGLLLLGLLRRERYGLGNIGFESFLVIVLYIGGFVVLFSGT
jgi:cation:H+ antiporter